MTESEQATSEQATSEDRNSSRGATLRAAALEAGLVVLGVVLAFAANEWRKARDDAERARHALEAVAHELEANREAVAASQAYHQEKMLGLRAAIQAGETVAPGFFGRGFVHPAQILSNAWDAATATDAILGWDYDDLLAVSRLYGDQEQYEIQSHGVSRVIYDHLLTEGTVGISRRQEQLAALVGTFWWRECELLAAYGKVLPRLGSEVPELPDGCSRGPQQRKAEADSSGG